MNQNLIIPALLLLAMIAGDRPQAKAQDHYQAERARMIRAIEADVTLTSARIGKGALTARVLAAMGRVARHEFVPPEQKPYAYENRPLPIGFGQTISQPYIVALMTDLLNVTRDATVLEIGTGSGYQAAILAELVKEVYTIEIIKPLADQATERFLHLGIANVSTRVGDGYYGWEEHAPFDGIVVTAAAGHVPAPLVKQLKPGGRMVIPVGGPFLTQQLMLVEKGEDGTVKTRQILPVAFVLLTGGH
jgi:protein-L-isoaspartate(D-aspartate) O-methyltransferase